MSDLTSSLLDVVGELRMPPKQGALYGEFDDWSIAQEIAAQGMASLRFSRYYVRSGLNIDWLMSSIMRDVGDVTLITPDIEIGLRRECGNMPPYEFGGEPEIEVSLHFSTTHPKPLHHVSHADEYIALCEELQKNLKSEGADCRLHKSSVHDVDGTRLSYMVVMPIERGVPSLQWLARKLGVSTFQAHWEILGVAERVDLLCSEMAGATPTSKFGYVKGVEAVPKHYLERTGYLRPIRNVELANLSNLAAILDNHAHAFSYMILRVSPVQWPCGDGWTRAQSGNSISVSWNRKDWRAYVTIDRYSDDDPAYGNVKQDLVPMLNRVRPTTLK